MLVFVSALIFTLFWYTIALPCSRSQKVKARREFEEHYRLVKLAAIREYYPELRDLSLREIALRYDYDEAFRRIR